MDSFNSSPALLNSVIKTKIQQIFLSGIKSNYQVESEWLDNTLDILIYTFNAKKLAANETINLEDVEQIDELVEAIVFQISRLIEQSVESLGKSHSV